MPRVLCASVMPQFAGTSTSAANPSPTLGSSIQSAQLRVNQPPMALATQHPGPGASRARANAASTNSISSQWQAPPPPRQQAPPQRLAGTAYVSDNEDNDSPGIPLLAPREPGSTSHRPDLARPRRPDTDFDSPEAQPRPVEGVGMGKPVPRVVVPRARVARALPMRLVPLSAAATLLDPATMQPLLQPAPATPPLNGSAHHPLPLGTVQVPTQGAGQQEQQGPQQGRQQSAGVALPLLGPWVVATTPRVFPHADAAVSLPPGAPPHAEHRLALRLEYVVQRALDPFAGSEEEEAVLGTGGGLDALQQLEQARIARAQVQRHGGYGGPPMHTRHKIGASACTCVCVTHALMRWSVLCLHYTGGESVGNHLMVTSCHLLPLCAGPATSSVVPLQPEPHSAWAC